MDWKDLALKAAEQINDTNWTRNVWWETNHVKSYNAKVFTPSRRVYDELQPSKACANGHLYWVAQDQGLTFEEANTLVAEVATEFTGGLAGFNDAYGRTAGEVAERLRLVATT